MLTELVKALYEVVTSLDVAICHNIKVNLDNSTNNLKLYLEQYKNTPQILYKEIFEPWCKVDVIRFCQLTNNLISKPEQWCEQSILIVPDIYTIAMTLCEVADEIEARLPDITTEKSEQPKELPAVEEAEQIILPKEFDTDEGHEILKKLEEAKLIARDETVYKWLGSSSLFGYFVLQSSDKLELRYDNTRLPWKLYKKLFNVSDSMIKTAKNVISALKKEHICEPEGWDTVKKICK